MKPKFKIVYVVKFFDGKTKSGVQNVLGGSTLTKSSVEKSAMEFVMMADYVSENECGIQKIDLTVIEIK